MENKKIGISIAGFDPSGGAGILTDIKTMHSFGIHGTSAITSLTAQNPKKVFSIEGVATGYVEEQIDSIFDEYDITYGKTGLLYSKEIIKLISKKVEEYNLKIVVDPVMVASAGNSLTKQDIANALMKYLIPKSLIVTPNLTEAEKLSGIKIIDEESGIKACKKIGKVANVIITGGHLNGTNIISINEEIAILKQNLIKSENTHGTGCSFSAAIVSNLILQNIQNPNSNDHLQLAIEKSSKFIYNAVKYGRFGTLNPKFFTKK